MEAIGIIFVDGIVIGSSTLLLALGLSLIFGVLAVVNVAHGALWWELNVRDKINRGFKLQEPQLLNIP